jgi:hypothetical protein
MAIQSDIGVLLSIRRETTYGTIATNDSTAKVIPHVSHSLALSKTAITSQEKRASFQRSTMRHGNRAVGGDLALQLQCGTYKELMESAVRRDFTAVTNIALSNVTATVAAPQFVRAAGSWITDGLCVGMTIRMTGWTTTGTNNNSRNYTIIALTATGITVAEPVAAKASGDALTISIPGRVTFMPVTGHTQTSYTVEEWNPDVPRSNRFLGARVNTMAIELPPNDRATLTFGFTGQDRAKSASQYFTSASTPALSVMQVGHTGVLVINGVVSGLITGLSINVTNNMQTGAAVGSALTPGVFHGAMEVTGQFQCYFSDATFDDIFDDETEISLIVRATDDTTIGGNFIQLCLPRIKLSGGSFSTQNESRMQSFDFTALEHAGTNGNRATTLHIQDSTVTS